MDWTHNAPDPPHNQTQPQINPTARPVSPLSHAITPVPRPDSAYFASPLSPIEYDCNDKQRHHFDSERAERTLRDGQERPARRSAVRFCGCIEPVFWSILVAAVVLVITAIVVGAVLTGIAE
ncbi:hypothetical protein IWX90DRAFT_485040 [Phyllosticta citrichinensis]|uniref:Uncharacterized protein n=1 Tax=Phyllosticta citrichinensis TaxID=1130410 RepID=A0ABR1Y156_9PEZI